MPECCCACVTAFVMQKISDGGLYGTLNNSFTTIDPLMKHEVVLFANISRADSVKCDVSFRKNRSRPRRETRPHLPSKDGMKNSSLADME